MGRQMDLDILDLDWISKIMGAHVDTSKLIQEIIGYLQKKLPHRRIRILLWDESKRKYILEVATGIKKVKVFPKVNAALLKANLLFIPFSLKKDLLIPLRN